MNYKLVSFTIICDEALKQTARDLLSDALSSIGYDAFAESANGIDAYIQAPLYHQEEVDNLLDTNIMPNVSFSYKAQEMPDKDWNEAWEKSGFQPISVENRIVVCDANHPTDYPDIADGQIPIYIAARQAFGTGTHETTRMVIAALLHHPTIGARALDCGCGTGILGIVASKLGAREVIGYDIDEWSVDNARHNAQLNRVKNMNILHGDSSVLEHGKMCFDILTANINRNILLADMPVFARLMTPNAILVLSGFYVQDAEMLLKKAGELGLEELERRHDGDWCCLTIRHKSIP